MKPILIFGGSFLFWIAARGRFPAYSALVRTASAASPADASSGSGGANSGVLDSAATTVNSLVSTVWNGFKKV